MAFVGNRSEEHRDFQTPPFHLRLDNGNTHSTFHPVNYDSELNLTHHGSLESIFMTDVSKNFEMNQQNILQNQTTTSMNRSHVVTTSFRKNSKDREDLTECPICCINIQSNELKQMPCCAIKLCSSCLLTHTITNIRNGKVKIECPACSQDINSSTILYNNEIPVPVRERYQEILAQDLAEKQNTYIKLCPHCNFITILDEDNPMINRRKSRRSSTEWIRCEQCNKEWCWSCYAPSHPNETCRQFKKNHTQLDIWAKVRRTDNQQRNAQRCPKCSIYIEKIDGCDHMLCTKCNSKFCYRCGSRMRLPFYVGHDAKYSIFGCKYKLWPNCPLLRWLIRGSIFTGVFLLTPVVLAAVVALVGIGIPILLIIACFALPNFDHQKIELSINEFMDSNKRFMRLQTLISRIESAIDVLIEAINEEVRPSNAAGSGPGAADDR